MRRPGIMLTILLSQTTLLITVGSATKPGGLAVLATRGRLGLSRRDEGHQASSRSISHRQWLASTAAVSRHVRSGLTSNAAHAAMSSFSRPSPYGGMSSETPAKYFASHCRLLRSPFTAFSIRVCSFIFSPRAAPARPGFLLAQAGWFGFLGPGCRGPARVRLARRTLNLSHIPGTASIQKDTISVVLIYFRLTSVAYFVTCQHCNAHGDRDFIGFSAYLACCSAGIQWSFSIRTADIS